MHGRQIALTLLAAFALWFWGGCTSLIPNRVTYSLERDDADTETQRRQRTATRKIGVQVTYELRP